MKCDWEGPNYCGCHEEVERLTSLLEEKDRELETLSIKHRVVWDELQRDKVLMDYVLTIDWSDERGGFPFFPVTRESIESHLKFVKELNGQIEGRE